MNFGSGGGFLGGCECGLCGLATEGDRSVFFLAVAPGWRRSEIGCSMLDFGRSCAAGFECIGVVLGQLLGRLCLGSSQYFRRLMNSHLGLVRNFRRRSKNFARLRNGCLEEVSGGIGHSLLLVEAGATGSGGNVIAGGRICCLVCFV